MTIATIKNVTATSAALYIYEEIGYYGLTALGVAGALATLPTGVTELQVRINSPGGNVFDGFAIYNLLKQHPAKKIVMVDGIAASIASVIAMCGDEIIMSENAMLMTHMPSCFFEGGSADFRKQADVMDVLAGNIANAYAEKTGMSKEDALAMMEAETWLDASQAMEKKMCTSTTAPMEMAASIVEKVRTRNYKKLPQQFAAPAAAAATADEQPVDCIDMQRRKLWLLEHS